MMKVDESSSKFFSWGLFLTSVFCFDVVLYLNYWFNHALVEIKAVEKFCDWIMWKRMFVTRIWVGIVEVVTQKFEQVTEAHFTGCFHKENVKIYIHSRCDGRSFLKGQVCTFLWCNPWNANSQMIYYTVFEFWLLSYTICK